MRPANVSSSVASEVAAWQLPASRCAGRVHWSQRHLVLVFISRGNESSVTAPATSKRRAELHTSKQYK